MRIEYEITKQDYVTAAVLAARKGALPSRLRHYYYYAFTALWLISTVGTSRSGGHWDLAGIAFGLAIFPFLAMVLWAERFKFSREYRRSANLHSVQQLDASESGIQLKTNESDTRSTWKAYSKSAENSRFFILFYPGNRTFIPIPKGAMNTQQITELRSLLKANLNR